MPAEERKEVLRLSIELLNNDDTINEESRQD